jgi:hypothetical protein
VSALAISTMSDGPPSSITFFSSSSSSGFECLDSSGLSLVLMAYFG